MVTNECTIGFTGNSDQVVYFITSSVTQSSTREVSRDKRYGCHEVGPVPRTQAPAEPSAFFRRTHMPMFWDVVTIDPLLVPMSMEYGILTIMMVPPG